MKVVISASLGHFQRPGNPGEPSTYPIIPPTAVAGVIDSIYWHPGHTVQVRSIGLINPIEYTTETVTQLDHTNGASWLRTYELLVNPAFLVDFWLECASGVDVNKRVGLLCRRLQSGQHYQQPCMGLSDFPAAVRLLAKDETPPPVIDIDMPIGPMPHYWQWRSVNKPGKKPFVRRTSSIADERPLQHSEGRAMFFDARLVGGIVSVPNYPVRGEDGYAA
ncbi:MAG: CRISPR-associated protein Cas5 [Alkalinema sp. CACIAM 70d]|nr:MAG: CRISPR-associated protein Cas5 [Alkalinema sp. CACIAM 70d]